MKDLIAKLLAALPIYARQLVALLLGPKTAILQQDLESDSALQQALTFLAVSFGIAYIAQIPFLPGGQDKELIFGVLAVQSAVAFSLNVALTILVWKVVGGKLAWKKLLVVTCYFSGVSTILSLAFFLIAAGTFKLMDPELYQQTMTGLIVDPSDMWNSGGEKAFVVLIGVAFVVVYAWIFYIWGAYRQLMQVGKLRSGIALLLFTSLSPLLIVIQMVMSAVLLPLRNGPPVPNELIGHWQAMQRTDANGMRVGYILGYTFEPPQYKIFPAGNYTMNMVEARGAINAKCYVSVTRMEYGQVVVHGSTMLLTPKYRAQSTKDDCSGKSWTSPTNLSKAEYQYQISQQPSGWTLCMSNRFGQFCLLPKPQ